MKTIEISKGGTTAVKIQLHDQELSVVVHDAVAVDAQEQVKELPVRMLYKGQRVRNLEDTSYVKKGATGTVDEDSIAPWVIWDSADMLTYIGQCEDRRLWRASHFLEVIEEVKEEPKEQVKELPVRMLYKGQRVRNLEYTSYVKKGATGTVDEDSEVPWVIWDSPDMLTDRGQCEDRRWAQASHFLEVIEEVSEAHAHIHLDSVTNGEYTGGSDDEPVEVKIPFDASRIAEAVRFETRDGGEVKSVVVNDVEAQYRVTGFQHGDHCPSYWDINGSRVGDGYLRNADLFMVVKEVRND